jgi:uncharacterized protein
MPTVKDVIVRKPTKEEVATCSSWPIWQHEPGAFDWIYTEKETCLLIEGKVTVSDGKNSVNFGKGDYVVFPDGLECNWHIHSAVKKYYNFG